VYLDSSTFLDSRPNLALGSLSSFFNQRSTSCLEKIK